MRLTWALAVLLSLPGCALADAGDLAQAIRLLLGQVEHRLAEGGDQLPGIHRADAADHAGAEVLLDALQRGGRGRLQEGGLELQSVGAVVDPDARAADDLAGRDQGGMADHRDRVALAADLYPQYAEASVGIVEGDPFHEASQRLGRRTAIRS